MNNTGVMQSKINKGRVQSDVDVIFVKIIGRLDMNKVAEGGSALLASND